MSHFPLIVILAIAPNESPTGGIRIDDLQPSETEVECGTSFHLPIVQPKTDPKMPQKGGRRGPQIFSIGLNSAKGFIRINGVLHDVGLIFSSNTRKNDGRWAVGDEYIQTWRDKIISVKFHCTVISVGEENAKFKGTMQVVLGKLVRNLDIEGESGC
jgi:hypothetical protein